MKMCASKPANLFIGALDNAVIAFDINKRYAISYFLPYLRPDKISIPYLRPDPS